MKNYTAVAFLLLLAVFAHASEQDTLFAQANEAYSKNNFTDASQTYTLMLEKFGPSPEIYYNLGNSYYRAGQTGLAALNYEKAARLAPNDDDINTNLAFIRKTVNEPEPGIINIILRFFSNLMTLNSYLLTSAALLFIFSIVLTVYLLRKNNSALFFVTTAGAMFIIFASISFYKYDNEVIRKWAVITSAGAQVYNGPGESNSVGFTLPEGRKVIILGEKDDWAAIGLEIEGLKGWIEKKYISHI